MGVPKSRASRQVLAHFSLMAPPQRAARDVPRLARLLFPQVYQTGPLSTVPSASSSGSRSLHASAVPTPNSPTSPLFFDSSLAEAAKDTGGSDGSGSMHSGSSLPLLGPAVNHPPPGPRFQPLGPRSALSNSTTTDSSSSGSLPNASPSLRSIGFPAPPNVFPPLFGSVVGFKNPRRGSFTLRNGASGIAKTRNDDLCQRKQRGKSRHIETPVPILRKQTPTERAAETTLSVQVGEDAYFLRSDSLGVADGVGGWTGRPGADSALFSRNLMHHCALELAQYEEEDSPQFLSYHDVDPVEVLQRAYERCVQEAREDGIVGSSTALLAVLRSNELRVANIGDCCCSVIRGNEYIFRSLEQQHSFNYPVQIGTNSSTLPETDAQGFTVKVQKNDIVILCSDGLVDNLFDEDILEEVLQFTYRAPPSTPPANVSPSIIPRSRSLLNLAAFSPQTVSEALCARAKAVSEDQHVVNSPFAQRAMEEGIYHIGGKQDDISVLVAIVGDQPDNTCDRR